jgi:hypothetical protein
VGQFHSTQPMCDRSEAPTSWISVCYSEPNDLQVWQFSDVRSTRRDVLSVKADARRTLSDCHRAVSLQINDASDLAFNIYMSICRAARGRHCGVCQSSDTLIRAPLFFDQAGNHFPSRTGCDRSTVRVRKRTYFFGVKFGFRIICTRGGKWRPR